MTILLFGGGGVDVASLKQAILSSTFLLTSLHGLDTLVITILNSSKKN